MSGELGEALECAAGEIAELRSERDKALEQVGELLEAVAAHRGEAPTRHDHPMDIVEHREPRRQVYAVQGTERDDRLYAAHDRIRSEQDKGLKDG